MASSTQRSGNGVLTIVLLVVAAIVLVPVLLMALAMPMMAFWWGGGMGQGGGISPLWGIGMAFFWLLVIGGAVYLLYRGLTGAAGPSTSTNPAMEELRLAYARGDLSEAEFEERREKLRREESE